jgi:hypothetical protein
MAGKTRFPTKGKGEGKVARAKGTLAIFTKRECIN